MLQKQKELSSQKAAMISRPLSTNRTLPRVWVVRQFQLSAGPRRIRRWLFSRLIHRRAAELQPKDDRIGFAACCEDVALPFRNWSSKNHRAPPCQLFTEIQIRVIIYLTHIGFGANLIPS